VAVEHAPDKKRGWHDSWPQMRAPTGLVLANLVFLPIAALPEAQLVEWGWRIPFLLSLVLAGPCRAIRSPSGGGTPAFMRLKKSHPKARQPLLEIIQRCPRPVLLATGARLAEAGTITVLTTFILSYATQVAGLPRPAVVGAVLLATIALIAIVPAAGALSDHLDDLGCTTAEQSWQRCAPWSVGRCPGAHPRDNASRDIGQPSARRAATGRPGPDLDVCGGRGRAPVVDGKVVRRCVACPRLSLHQPA
jgi:MFS family permease